MSDFETWYCVNGYSGSCPISPVEIERHTAKSVWVKENYGKGWRVSRYAVRSAYDNYFPTWEEAHQFLSEQAQNKRDSARKRLDQAISFQDRVRKLRKEDARGKFE